MSPNALVGLAVTAHDDTALATATFTGLNLVPGGGDGPNSGQRWYTFSDTAGQLVAKDQRAGVALDSF
jgi:hypothetical protein